MGKRLYVGNLSFNTDEDGLRAAFEKCGTVKEAKIVIDRESGRSRGFAFVEMSSEAEAGAAMASWNGQALDGRTLNVNEAKEREPRSGGGGGYGGGGGRGGNGGSRRGSREDRY